MNIQVINLLLSFVITVIIGLIVLPKLKKLKIGQVVREDGPKSHLSKNGTPIMGGIIMIIAVTILLISYVFKYNILVMPMVAMIGFGFVGFIDDYKKLVLKTPEGLSPKKKMIGLFLVVCVYIILHINVFKLGTEIIIPVFNQLYNMHIGVFIAFIVIVLLSVPNAINLTDGLDGLAAGVVAIIMTFFTIIGIRTGDTSVIILGSITVGTCLGFLVFNIHPAKMFMGDTGSLALGGLVASIAIITKMPIYLLLVAIVCIIDTLSVILQVTYFKLTKGKRIFKMAPYHHHLELSGMKETKVVTLFYIVTVIACVVALFI